jgi:hypothetical protein
MIRRSIDNERYIKMCECDFSVFSLLAHTAAARPAKTARETPMATAAAAPAPATAV